MCKIYTYIRLTLLFLVLIHSACVNDDSFFPEGTDSEIVPSVAVVTVLNELKDLPNDFSENQLCFQFVYPLYLGYNTNSTVRVNNFEGLRNVIGALSSNFNIVGLQFPFEVVLSGGASRVVISDESEFISVLRNCQIDTLRDDFNSFYNECFRFDFPITLISEQNENVQIDSLEVFQSFYNTQSLNYQPQFKFPFTVVKLPDLESVEIGSYYDFYEILDSCSRCPQLSYVFDSVDLFNLGYVFTATVDDSVTSYDWIIDNQVIETDGTLVDGDNQLQYTFQQPGSYTVCITTETPNCPQGISYCQIIFVETRCPDLFFSYEQEPGTLDFSFTANFPGINTIWYDWVIDEQFVDDTTPGDNNLSTTLTPGVHTICIKSDPPSCTEGASFCEEIVVDPICPDLAFTYEQEQGTSSYTFTAAFDGIGTTFYDWVINGDIIASDGGPNGENILFRQFTPGTYQVCITAITDTCPDGVEFCEEIVVD